jgi:phosphonate transport system substrate-binding protein
MGIFPGTSMLTAVAACLIVLSGHPGCGRESPTRPPPAVEAPAAQEASAAVAPGKPATCPAGTRVADRIRFGVPAFGIPSFVARGFEPIAAFLSERIGLPVEIVTMNRYDELSEAIVACEIEVASLPPLEYVDLQSGHPCIEPRLTLVDDGAIHYSSYLLVRKDRGLTDIRQLAGRRIAFVDTSSASGYLFAMARLLEAGIDPERDFASVLMLGSHLAVIDAIIEGRADAGATYSTALDMARREGRDVGSLGILAITGRIPMEAIVLCPDMDPAQAEAVIKAFRGLDTTTPHGRAALGYVRSISGWVPTSDRLYDPVRAVRARVRQAGGHQQ